MHARSTVDNVVALDSRLRARSSRHIAPKSATVINDCRELALNRICELVTKAFDNIENELFELAQGSVDRELQNVYLDARAQSREKRGSIESAFRQRFLGEFDGKVRGDVATPVKAAPVLELKLVDEADLEESIAMSAMASTMKSGSEEELGALTQRLGFLMDEPDMAGAENPLSPETVCRALQDACGQINAGSQVKLTLLRMCQQHVTQDLTQVYRDVNARLVELHRVLPDIRVTYRAPIQPSNRPAPSAQGPEGTYKAASADNAARTTATSNAGPSHPSHPPQAAQMSGAGGDLFSMLQQLMSGAAAHATQNNLASNAVAQNAATHFVAPHGRLATSDGTAPLPPAMPMSQLLGQLTSLQQQMGPVTRSTSQATSGNTQNDSIDLAAALNVLRDIGTRELKASASQVDSMTIDIVAMLFDYVFSDRQIPSPIKALLARLQIPILKAALLDKCFFSQKTHPARLLLDGLAELALQCDESVDESHPSYQFMEALVGRVQLGFDTDLGVFTQEVNGLQAFMTARDESGSGFVEQSTRLIHDREQREIARVVAENAIAGRLDGKTLPAAVVVMLKARWVDVLKHAWLASGEDGAAWGTACQVVDDLLWSLEPKLSVDDRKRLVGLLPRMLRILQQGLSGIEVAPGERERFFSALVDHHARAVKAGLRQPGQTDAARDAAREATASELVDASTVHVQVSNVPEQFEVHPGEPGLMRIHLEADGVRVEEIRMTADREPLQTARPTLSRGTWVEFKRPDGRLRAKLSWISPHKGVMLFTNPDSARAISLTPDAFALQLHDGLVRIFAEVPLSERAVDSVLEDLRAA